MPEKVDKKRPNKATINGSIDAALGDYSFLLSYAQ
jgi:hypothetical protein